MARCWLYIVTDRATGRVIYVGQTLDTGRRWKQHESKHSKCALMRKYVERKQASGERLKFEIEPRLPNGVPFHRSDEFEAVLMVHYKTIFDPDTRPDGCNQNHAAHVADVDFAAVRAELDAGYEWPVKEAQPDALAKACAEEAMLGDLVDAVGDLLPELQTQLATATSRRKAEERRSMGPLAFAEALAADYEGMSRYAPVDRAEVAKDLNALRDRLNEEELVDREMIALVNAKSLFAKDEGRTWQMSAAVAAHGMRELAEALWTRDEAALEETKIVMRVRRLRKWTSENGNRKPNAHARIRKYNPGTPEEEVLGSWLQNWKHRGCKSQRHACDLIMHHVSWWKEFCEFNKEETNVAALARLNDFLRAGYAMKAERKEQPFEGMKEMTHTVDLLAYNRLNHILRGQGEPGSFENVLVGVDPRRAEWIRNRHAANHELNNKRNSEKTERGKQLQKVANDADPSAKRPKI